MLSLPHLKRKPKDISWDVAAADGRGADMSTLLEYKGYLGSVEYSVEDEALHGRLEFIRDLVLQLRILPSSVVAEGRFGLMSSSPK
jgi:hypothetical protein